MAENALRASQPLHRTLIAEYGLHRWHTERAYFAGAITLVAAMLVASSDAQPLNILTWVSYLALFIAGELFTGQVENGAWTGYPHFAALLLWLTGGLNAALSMILVGSILVGLLRLLLKSALELPSITWSQAASLTFGRIAVTGMAVIAAAFVYGLAGFRSPLEALSILQLLALLAALAAAWLVSQIVGLLLTTTFAYQPVQQLWTKNQARLPLELLTIAAVITLALIANRVGSAPHAAVVALVIVQALRQRNVSLSDDLLRQRVAELSLLNQVGEVMAASLVTGDLLDSLHKTLADITGAPALYVALYDPQHDLLDFAIATEHDERVVLPQRYINHSAASWVIRHKKSLHLRAASADTLREMDITPTEYEQKYPYWLILPLLNGPQPVGVIGVMSNRVLPVFDTAGIALMEAIARQAALAIHNASLYQRSSELVGHLSLMNQSVEQMMTNLDRTDAVDGMCETARKIGKADAISLHLIPQLGMPPQIVYASGLSAEQQAAAALPREPFSETIRVLLDVSDNAAGDALQKLAQQLDMKALIELPLRSNSTTRGFLTLYYAKPHYPHQTELELLQMLSGQISTVIDNTELFNALETYAFEMAQLAHLSHVLTSDLDLDRVLTDVTQVLSQVMLMTRVVVALIDPEDNRLRVAASYTDPAWLPEGAGDVLLEFPELAALAEPHVPGRAFHVDEAVSPELGAWLREHGEATIALIPMRISGALIGVIMLGSHEKRVLTEREWQLAETAVNQVAGQIQNARLYTSTQAALRQRLEQLALIEALAQQISSALDLDQIISTVLQASAQSTQATCASLVLLPDDSNARSMVVRYIDGQLERSFLKLSYDDSSIGQVIRSRRPVNIPDRRRTPVTGVLHAENALSSLAVPLLTDHGVIGVLKVESDRLNAFTDEHASFLSNLAGHAAISLGNAKLLEERHYQLKVMNSLHDLALRLSSTTDMPSAANAILETTLDLFEGSLEAGLFQYEPQRNWLSLQAHQRRAPALPGRGARFPASIAWEAAETGEIQIVRLSRDSHDETDSAKKIGCISVPLKRGNEVRQVLSIAFPGNRSFPKRDLDTLELLVGQAAGHLENVMLHEQVRAGHERLSTILNSTRDGIILLDHMGALVAANPAAQQMFGGELSTYLDEVVTAAPWKALIAAGDGAAEAPPARRQFQHGAIHLEENGVPVTDAQGCPVGWLLVLRDITEEKLLESYRDEITHMVVHDLRAPLATIIQSIQLSLEEIQKYEGLQVEANSLALTSGSARRLMLLVESMLSIAKLEARELQLNIEAVPLELLVENAAVIFEVILQQSEITLQRVIPPDLPWIRVDNELTTRVLMNLLDNALRYTPLGKTILINAEWHESEGYVLVRVADSGRGIPPEERTQIFEKFKQAKGSVSFTKQRGTGLGLNFCKLVVEAHGGRIWVEDESPLDGASFAFTVPAEPI